MTNAGLTDVASRLPDLFGRKEWQLLWQTYNLVRKWPEIAGPELAAHTRPAYIRSRTLWIEVDSSMWMQHLQLQKEELLARVPRSRSGEGIAEIRFTLATESAPAANSPEPPTRRAVDPAAAEGFMQLAATIENKECRKALYQLWLTFQQHR